MVPPSADEWWKIDEPDEPDAPPEPVTLANAVGTLFNSDWPFEVLQVPRPESPMSFQDAILNSLMNFKDFSGRATRSEFWWFQLFFVANIAFFGTIFQGSIRRWIWGFGILAFLRPSVGPKPRCHFQEASRSRLPRMDLPRSFHPVLESLVRICPDGLPRV